MSYYSTTADVPRRRNPSDHGDRDCRGDYLIVRDPQLALALGVEFDIKRVAAARLDGGTRLKGGPLEAYLALEDEIAANWQPFGPPSEGDHSAYLNFGRSCIDGDRCSGLCSKGQDR